MPKLTPTTTAASPALSPALLLAPLANLFCCLYAGTILLNRIRAGIPLHIAISALALLILLVSTALLIRLLLQRRRRLADMAVVTQLLAGVGIFAAMFTCDVSPADTLTWLIPQLKDHTVNPGRTVNAVGVAAAISPLLSMIELSRWSAKCRRPNGFCRKCGYDLRYAADRCPECGLSRTAKSA